MTVRQFCPGLVGLSIPEVFTNSTEEMTCFKDDTANGGTNINASLYTKRSVTTFLTGINMLSFHSSSLTIEKNYYEDLTLC